VLDPADGAAAAAAADIGLRRTPQWTQNLAVV
jgi:hypothetical protein